VPQVAVALVAYSVSMINVAWFVQFGPWWDCIVGERASVTPVAFAEVVE
jgi:hypothetical protein